MYTNWQTTHDWIQSPQAEIEVDHTNYWKPLSYAEIGKALMLSQPHFGDNVSCVALVILGYYDMPWVTIPCDLLLPNTAVMCEVAKGDNMQHLSGSGLLQLTAYQYLCPEFWVLVNITCLLISQHPMPPRMFTDYTLASSNEIRSNEDLRLYINIYLMYHNPKPLKTKHTNGKCSKWQLKSNIDRFVPERLVEEKQLDCGKITAVPIFQQSAVSVNHTCHPGHFRCADGSCISNIYQCDGYIHCHDDSDEKDCEPVCFTRSAILQEKHERVALNTWCRTNCSTPTCHYEENWYQCISGGCIHFSFVCDGETNCFDGSDEVSCHQDNIAEHRRIIMADRNLLSQTNCSEWTVSCSYFEKSCFPLDKLCVFERHIDGTPAFCTKSKHIRGCSPLQCPGRFKCNTAYCIPLYMVCNKAIDCPNGDDEIRCDFIRCLNLFRCNKEQTCIDLKQIQDGRPQCSISGEDELAFHLVPCPSICLCRGFVMSCESQSLHLIPSFPLRVKVLLFKGNRLQSLTTILMNTYYSEVLKLDLSDNIIDSISKGKFPKTLLFLNISYNCITVVERRSFALSTKLLQLHLQGNFIHIIAEHSLSGLANSLTLNLHAAGVRSISAFSFSDLARLQVLNLSNNELQVLDRFVLHGLHSLMFLDIRENKNMIILPTSFDLLLKLETLTTDQLTVCCFNRARIECEREDSKQQYKCERLIPTIALRLVWWLICFLMIIFNLASFIFWYHSSIFPVRYKVKPFFLLPPCLNVTDILYAVYLLTIAGYDQGFQEAFPAYRGWWLQSVGCNAALILSHLSVYSSFSFAFFICLYRYMATVHPLKQSVLETKRTVLVFMALTVLSECTLLVIGSSFNSGVAAAIPARSIHLHGFCFMMYPVTNWAILSHALYLILTALLVICQGLLSSRICKKLSEKTLSHSKERERRSRNAIIRLFVHVSSNCISWMAICTQQVSLLLRYSLPFYLHLSFIMFLFPANSCICLWAVTFQSTNFKAFLSAILGRFQGSK